MIPPGKYKGTLIGPYYNFGGGGPSAPPRIDYDALLRNSEASARFAREQSQLAHSQALEMEATRNAYAMSISEKEEQNERQLEAQQQAMENLLSDVEEGVDAEEEQGITSVQFYTSLMNAMQGGVGAGSPMPGENNMSGNKPPSELNTGANIYSGARPV